MALPMMARVSDVYKRQLLVYAQRPDATAVLEIERWNRQFGRWVNRGANGIAVFDGEHNGKPRLKYYFDISDTHEARFPRPVPLWTVRVEYAPDIIETLENSFGELERKEDLGEALLSAAKNAVEDNMPDYLSELKTLTEGSFLEELDELNLEVEYRRAVQNSIGYMLLVRCGLDPSEYFEDCLLYTSSTTCAMPCSVKTGTPAAWTNFCSKPCAPR